MTIDHNSRAKKAWPILVRLAIRKAQPITYGELSACLGLHPRSARWFLGVIQEYCDGKGLPALQALAVNKRTRLPGIGYVGSSRTKAAHGKELQRVYEYGKQWPAKAPKFGG